MITLPTGEFSTGAILLPFHLNIPLRSTRFPVRNRHYLRYHRFYLTTAIHSTDTVDTKDFYHVVSLQTYHPTPDHCILTLFWCWAAVALFLRIAVLIHHRFCYVALCVRSFTTVLLLDLTFTLDTVRYHCTYHFVVGSMLPFDVHPFTVPDHLAVCYRYRCSVHGLFCLLPATRTFTFYGRIWLFHAGL